MVLELMRLVYVPGTALAHHRRLTEAIRGFFEQGVAQGDVPPDRDPAFLSEIGGAAYFGIVMNWMTIPDYPLRDRLRQLAEVADRLLADQLTPQRSGHERCPEQG